LSARSAAALLAVVAVALPGPATAAAEATTLSGATAEGAAVRLQVAEFGNATSFVIAKTEVKCHRGGTLTTRKTTYGNFDRSDPGSFAVRSSGATSSGAWRFRTKTKIRGDADASGAWSGTFREKTTVVKHGDKTDTCRLSTTWTAG
jgi:hypothetical protein